MKTTTKTPDPMVMRRCRECRMPTVHASTCSKRCGTAKKPLPLYGPHVMVKPEDCDE